MILCLALLFLVICLVISLGLVALLLWFCLYMKNKPLDIKQKTNDYGGGSTRFDGFTGGIHG